MIELVDVYRDFGKVRALRGVTFRAEETGVVGLLGQNGAGKTTVMRLITGLLAPTRGSVRVMGFDPLISPEEARRSMGVLPEVPPLYDEMTAREYLRFICELKGLRRINAEADELIERTGLSSMADRLIGHLSKGYRQRTGLAAALCGKPSLLILDEPTAGLDPRQIVETRQLIREVSKECLTLFSTHILPEAQQLCDRVIILENGVIRLDRRMKDAEEELHIQCTFVCGKEKAGEIAGGIPGLRSFEILPCEAGCTALRLTFDRDVPAERLIFNYAGEKGLTLVRLCREENSLEKLFLEVVSGEVE